MTTSTAYLDQAIRLAQETARCLRSGSLAPSELRLRKIDPTAIAEELDAFVSQRLLPIRHRWKVAQETPYVLALVGLTNVGKSTILEALLQARIVPRGNRPMTSVPVWYRHAPTWALEIAMGGARIQRREYNAPSELLPDLRALMTDRVHPGGAVTAWVRVTGPLALLANGLELVDTPGFGAAQDESEGARHQERLDAFLKTRVHRIYFCVAAADALVVKPEEHAYYNRLREACGHVIVNKWTGTPAEQSEYVSRHQALFCNAEFVFVNARRAGRRILEGATASDSDRGEQLEPDGFERLVQLVDRCASPAGRIEACEHELADAWRDLVDHADTHLDLRPIPWQPFEFRRLAALTPRQSPLGRTIQHSSGALP